jgi:hypothetical protein
MSLQSVQKSKPPENQRAAGQSDGSDNLSATLAASRAFSSRDERS